MLEVGTRLFSRRGYHAVSVDDVAAAAGVTKPMVYSYFDSKEGLFVACAEHAEAGLLADLEASAIAHQEPDLRMWHGLLCVFRFIEEHAEAWRVLYPPPSQGPSPVASGAAGTTAKMVALMTAQMHESARARGLQLGVAEIEPFAHAFVAASIAVGSWWLAEGEGPAEAQALRVMNFAWQGMGDLLDGRVWLPPVPS
jgi:AcrR family transcriptional regulator